MEVLHSLFSFLKGQIWSAKFKKKFLMWLIIQLLVITVKYKESTLFSTFYNKKAQGLHPSPEQQCLKDITSIQPTYIHMSNCPNDIIFTQPTLIHKSNTPLIVALPYSKRSTWIYITRRCFHKCLNFSVEIFSSRRFFNDLPLYTCIRM